LDYLVIKICVKLLTDFSFEWIDMSYRNNRGFGYGQIRRVQRVHARRSKRAKCIDESLRAPIAKTPEQWLAQPNRFDFPNVDTPNDKVSKEEQDRRLAEIRRFEATHSPNNHGSFRHRLNMHKICGVTH
jgi:hypothetical protein